MLSFAIYGRKSKAGVLCKVNCTESTRLASYAYMLDWLMCAGFRTTSAWPIDECLGM